MPRGKKNKKSKPNKTVECSTSRLSKYDENYPQDIPQEFTKIEKDWAESPNVLREVIDQGIRKTCWTIALTRGLSARLFVNKVVTSPVRLSALHLLTRIKGSSTRKKKGSEALKENMEGIKEILEKEGVIEEDECECDSNKPKWKPDSQRCFERLQGKRVHKARNLIIIEKVNEENLIRLLEKGPVVVTMDVHDNFCNYRGGIYEGPGENSESPEPHMLLLTGYGTENGIHYWIFQNSWGKQWGEEGFGRILRQISRGENQPSFFTSAIYPEFT